MADPMIFFKRMKYGFLVMLVGGAAAYYPEYNRRKYVSLREEMDTYINKIDK